MVTAFSDFWMKYLPTCVHLSLICEMYMFIKGCIVSCKPSKSAAKKRTVNYFIVFSVLTKVQHI